MPAETQIQNRVERTKKESFSVFTADEAEQLFDATARRYMNMSGQQFLRHWDAGEFRDFADRARVMRVAMLIPLVRKTSARKKSR